MQILAIYNQRILFHPFFLSCSFLVIYREKKNARKTRIGNSRKLCSKGSNLPLNYDFKPVCAASKYPCFLSCSFLVICKEKESPSDISRQTCQPNSLHAFSESSANILYTIKGRLLFSIQKVITWTIRRFPWKMLPCEMRRRRSCSWFFSALFS